MYSLIKSAVMCVSVISNLYSSACLESLKLKTDLPSSTTNSFKKQGVIKAWYADPSTRYDHGILGDNIEPTTLKVLYKRNGRCHNIEIRLPENLVFEDLAPRLADVDRDGILDVVAIQSNIHKGAKIIIYKIHNFANRYSLKELASTPFIGKRHRWLAPVGIADLDGNGYIEIAYIDRPHLAQILRIWRYKNGKLTQIAHKNGYTNHKIGDKFISGGIRYCGSGTEIITADGWWQNIVATKLKDGKLVSKVIAKYKDSKSFATALVCKNAR